MDQDLKKLQGKWELISLKKDGITAGAREIWGSFIFFKNDSFIETGPDYEFSGRTSLRSGTSHAEMVMNIAVNCTCEKLLKGIYGWEGDLLKICFSESITPPDVMDSKPGTGWTLKIFKKKK